MKNIGIAIMAILMLACTDNFDEINENPNLPETVAPQFLLSNIISVAADRNTYEQGFNLSNYLAQFSASVEFERIDRYEMGSNSDYWNIIFRLQSDIRSMQEMEGSNEAYVAVGNIMRSYLFSQLTDLYGDVPYTDAVNALDGNFSPAYDTQESIYMDPETGILAVLANSVETLKSTNSTIQGDMMFNNDLNQWIRFANSLRVRYYLRVSNKITDFSTLQSIVANEDLMQSNADNAVVPYLSSAPNQWPMSFAGLGLYQEHRMTQTVDSVLSLWNDPRVEILYKPSEQSLQEGNPQFVGLQNGQSRETIASKGINLSNISLFGSIFRDVPNGVDGQFMQYAELQFALAEASLRNLIQGNATEYYQAGIRASFDYWGANLPADYFSRPAIALTGNIQEDLVKIMTQKWLSLINNGHEAWFNVRRTGIPNLQPGPDNLNGGRYPVRYLYPESEQATNAENFQAAAERIGGNTINSKGWWESE
ncbi:SusD/RagB family nutrient-binding outer membrane lipoprotein [Marivirga sp.]|uniref:SusD/RagB family nutrient-binding outer membrane lipoprotein n=1 Tax=Marivirga sp. TaxID=2018662 RepID=UPI002D7FC6EE|nr:SusD/RagB family nutrient-binding outer membrane lipoprotein [Marivirga sp.]HET8858398.1 SusD/RagB family nutrient-binding outer membrane lipoprotein [Marivirga sp.]